MGAEVEYSRKKASIQAACNMLLLGIAVESLGRKQSEINRS
jgi:hypothetical protein